MSDYEFVTVQNFVSEKLKSYTDDGQLVELGPRGTQAGLRDMTVEEFRALQADYGDKVGIIERGAKSISKFVQPKIERIWIANMTGNPDAPDMVPGYNNKGEFGDLEPSPKKKPRTLYIQGVGRYDEEKRSEGGIIIKKTWPGREVSLEPFSQIEVTKGEAHAFLMADQILPEGHRGSCVVSEDIGNIFQPEISWDLDTRRAYLEMLPEDGAEFPAGKKVLGASEAEVREAHKDEHPREIARALDAAKKTCWERIVLRLFRPAIKKPTQKQFEAFLSKKLPESKKPALKKKAAPAPEGAVSDLLESL
jgi:hypothetical protein